MASHVRQALNGLATVYAERGRSLKDLGSAKELAARMVAIVPSPSEWDEVLGPFYSTSRVTGLLGNVSRQAVADRRRRGTLLGLRTADGAWVYPTFQFGPKSEVLAGLPAVLQCFAESAADDWTLAAWLVAPQRGLGGASIVGWLASGKAVDKVLPLAHAQAERYAR